MIQIDSAKANSQLDKELDLRIRRFRAAMVKERLDAIVITCRANYEYLTGYTGDSWLYTAGPAFAILTQQEFIVVARISEEDTISARRRPFTTSYYRGFQIHAVHKALEVIHHIFPAGTGVIGIDYGQDMFGRGCLELVDGIRSMGLSLVTAEKAIWSVRKIKTAYELEQKKKAFAIVNHAFDKTFQDASSNMSKDDLIRSMKCNLLNFGAETCDLGSATVYGRGTYQPDRNVHFEDGDYFFYDCYAYYNRYPADRERCIRVGEPTYEQIKDYSDVRNLTIEICKNIRAGMVAKDVFAIFEKLSRENGIGPFQTGTGRIGHDSGMEIVEPNCSITKDSEDPVLPGMIIHIEPKLKKHGGVYLFEEVVYVKPDGIEFVSELSPEECPIIPVQ